MAFQDGDRNLYADTTTTTSTTEGGGDDDEEEDLAVIIVGSSMGALVLVVLTGYIVVRGAGRLRAAVISQITHLPSFDTGLCGSFRKKKPRVRLRNCFGNTSFLFVLA